MGKCLIYFSKFKPSRSLRKYITIVNCMHDMRFQYSRYVLFELFLNMRSHLCYCLYCFGYTETILYMVLFISSAESENCPWDRSNICIAQLFFTCMCVNHESITNIKYKKTLKIIYIQGVPKLELRSVSETKRAYSKNQRIKEPLFLCQAI